MMMSKTIQLIIEDKLATQYEQLSPAEKDKIVAVVEDLIRAEVTTSEKIAKRIDHLVTYDLGGKFDGIDIRKAAYE